MKVKELIEKLQTFNTEDSVFISDPDSGWHMTVDGVGEGVVKHCDYPEERGVFIEVEGH